MLTSTGRVTAGRPNKITDDDGRFTSRTRIAWLLRMSRLYGHDPELAVARRCVAALSAHQGPVTPSQISRWENGVQPVPYRVIRAYEDLLGLPPSHLCAAVDTVHQIRSARPGAPRLDRRFVPGAGLTAELDDLLDRCLGDGPVRGADWDGMSARALAMPHVYLPRQVWSTLTARLLSEMSVSRGYGYLYRWEALRRLQGLPVAREEIAAAVSDMVADPASQVVVDPLMLLVHDRQAIQLLVDEIAAPTTERTLHAALGVCELAVEAGRFGGDDATTLDVLVRAHLTDHSLPSHLREAADDLAAKLAPPSMRATVRRRRGDQDAAVVAALTTTAEAALDVSARGTSAGENRMLCRLVDELLFGRQIDVRLGAAAVLAASPFRKPLGDALANAVTTALASGDRSPLTEWAFALGAIGDTDHRPALEALLVGQVPPGAVAQAAFSLGNLPGRTDPATLTRIACHHGPAGRRARHDDAEEVTRAVLYAAGMQRADAVLADVCVRTDLPVGARAAASWWLARHGAVDEE